MKERDIAEKMIKDGEAMVAEAKSKLAELDKPKLRHGEIRHWPSACKTFYGGNLCGMVDLSGGEVHVVWLCAARNNMKRSCKSEEDILRTSKHVSCMMDDIAARNEELEEFQTDFTFKFTAKQSKRSNIWLQIHTGSSCYTIDETQEICDKLQKVINFARNK